MNPNWVKGMPSANPLGRPKGSGAGRNLLSGAYKVILTKPLNEELKTEFHMEDGATWADLIAITVAKRAIGKVPDDKICFRAITELRETTEGKTPDKVIAAGSNEELANLAKIMQGNSAEEEDEPSGDEQVENAGDVAFSFDPPDGKESPE